DPVVTSQKQNGHHSDLFDNVPDPLLLSQKKSNLSRMDYIKPTSLKLSHVLSCPSACENILLTPDGEALVFVCEAIIVLMDIRSKRQQHLLGHTDVVTGLAIDPATRLLASSQSAPPQSYTCEVGVVHLWRLPEKTSPRTTHRPIGTGRMESVKKFYGVALSENAEFLLAHGCDHAGSAMIIVWNAKAVEETAVLPLVTYTFTRVSPRQLNLLPLTSESERNKNGVVLRFMTTEGFESRGEAESQRFGSKPNRTESGLCIWNLQENTNQKTLDPNAKTRRSFRSAQFTLLREAQLPSDLNFTDCCLKPRKRHYDQENGGLSYTPSYSMLVCSSTGHLMEFDPDSCEIHHLYRIIKYQPEGNNEESSAKIYHLSGHKDATKYADCKSGVGLTKLAWIQQDSSAPHGWLVTGSDDGCLRLWNELSPSATPKLEVTYAGPICSLAVSLIGLLPEPQDTNGLPFATIALSTKTGGLAGLILSVECPLDGCSGESDDPKLDHSRPIISGCMPIRLLSWPLDGPIVSTDLISCNPSASCSILCIATLHGSIKIWKLLSSTRKVGVSKTESSGDVCLRTLPLFDLRVSGDPPCHVALQPAVIGGQTGEISDYSWLRLGCGYRGTGLVRIFDPSSASLLYTLTTDNICDVTALLFSSCGSYLYATDASGELALWGVPQIRRPYHHEKKEPEPRLLGNRSRAVAVFRRCVEPSSKHTYSSPTCCLSQSNIRLSPDDQKLVYVDQTQLLITVARAYTLETLFQVHLNRAFDKHPEEALEVVSDQLDRRRTLFNFSCMNPITDSHDLLVAMPNGYLCRFDGSTGELIAYCRPPNGGDEKGDKKDHGIKYCEIQEGAYWSAMCVSPDGNHVVLAAAARPILYTTTTNLCHLPDGPEKKRTNSFIFSVPKFRQFVGHLHAVSTVLITGDQQFCLTVDGGLGVTNEASTPTLGSAIYVWQLSESDRRQITEYSLSGTAVRNAGNKPLREKSTALTRAAEQHKADICLKEDTPKSQLNSENVTIKSGKHPPAVPWPHSHPTTGLRDSPRQDTECQPTSAELDRITREESHLRFMPLRTYSGKCIQGLIGYTNQQVAVDSVVWDPDSGLFVYTADAFLICESLETGEQVVYATQLANDGEQTNPPPVLMREFLNSLVLSPNRRLLIIGTTAVWFEAGQCMNSKRRLHTSAVVSIPVKFTRLYPYRGLSAPGQRVTLDYESVRRLNYSSILRDCLEGGENASIHPTTTSTPVLKTMAFSSSSQYLITVGDESAPVVCLWCVRTWTILSFTWTIAITTKISCSFLCPTDFVTVGYVHKEQPTLHQGHLFFWHIDNTEQKLVNEPPASTASVECVDKFSTAIHLLGPEMCNGNNPSLLQSDILREILIVASTTGSIDVWDPIRRCKLARCSTGDSEIGLLSPCGPFSFVSGSASGTLSLWRVINASCLQQLHSMNAVANSDHNEGACVNQCIVGLKLIKQITGLPEASGRPITSATFDPEGQIGIVASGCSTLRYIDWSDVETCSQSTELSPNASTHYGQTCLLNAPSAALIGLFCLKRVQMPGDESTLVNEKPKAEFVLVSVTSHGTIQVWDPHSRDRISELQVGPHHPLAPAATCACCLETSTRMCVEGPFTGSSRMLGVQAACLAVAFNDTSIRLICLHMMAPVASTKALSPANADSAAAIQFLGTSHLVMGTNRGFLILLRITARSSDWKVVPLRILREHVNQNLHHNCLHQLEVFPLEVSFDPVNFTSRFAGTSFAKDLARKCERVIPGVQNTVIHMQSNRTFLSESKQIEQTPAWLWLAISGDRRLSVWLFVDRRQLECVSEHVVRLERCHLIAWLLLDSLVDVQLLGKTENAAEKHKVREEEETGVSGSDLGRNFKVSFVQKKLAHNKRTVCAMIPLESISILIAHSDSVSQTHFWLHSFYPTQVPMKLCTVPGMLDALFVTPSETTNQSLCIEPIRAFILVRGADRLKLLSAVFDAGSAVCSDWIELIRLPLSACSTGPNQPLLRLIPTIDDGSDHEASVVLALGANLIIL
ncbi:hypothetical protein CSKR_105442, partial [Clonorchis sinensis]